MYIYIYRERERYIYIYIHISRGLALAPALAEVVGFVAPWSDHGYRAAIRLLKMIHINGWRRLTGDHGYGAEVGASRIRFSTNHVA